MSAARLPETASNQSDQSQYGAGYFERQLRQAMDDMRMFRSFEGLRELTAEILNEMARGTHNDG